MKTYLEYIKHLRLAVLVSAFLLLGVVEARAHCDTMDGPVVMDAREALAAGDITPVLKWIVPEDEQEVKDTFAQTLIVREKGPEAKKLADRFFFETLVRLHRKSEGAPYTGLKPAGTNPGPAISGADHALENGSVDELIDQITSDVAAELRESFRHTYEAKQHADDGVEAGRDYVERYVHFIHLAKRIHDSATGSPTDHGVTTADL